MTLASKRSSQAHLGLWLDFAMFNHSCVNNAVNWTLEDKMIVRASRNIEKVCAQASGVKSYPSLSPQGEEICINYLGRGCLTPVELRQETLSSGYGFSCCCPR